MIFNMLPLKKHLLFVSACSFIVITISQAQNLYNEPWSDKSLPNRCPKMYHRNFVGYAPRGNLTAGNYTDMKNLSGLKQCVMGCCVSETCNVVFIHEATCYHIQCASNDLCLPLLRTESPRLGSHVSMILVNPVSPDESWTEILELTNYRSDSAVSLEDEIYNNFAPNTRNEIMADNSPLDFIKFSDRGNELLSRYIENSPRDDSDNGLSQFMDKDERMVMEASDYMDSKVISCEIGIITDCQKNEECVSIISKSRNGICKCKQGYSKSSLGVCEVSELSPIMPFSDELSARKGNAETSNLNQESVDISGLSGSKVNSESPVESGVKKLTIYAMSKEIRLPENEISLSAYTVPDEKTSNDHYSYLWTLVDQPKGGFTGNMKQNGGTVTLTQLTEGNYQFKVSVNGTHSYGESYANVTVLPAKRLNQPPVVVITPATQTVKLPNTGAVLDGSASKDDDAIISWHWELTSGPLGYQPPLHDGSTLQLTDLKLPGNYTFKLTVEDSDHIKNSTTANITVLNHTDYPPEANAGQDVIIYLPNNNLTLNGSLSADDHEIATWEWTKSAEDQNKAVDMQNTHSPYLQLSNLSEGMYTFVLKVTDSSGQSSTAEVHVFVKPPTNTPPTADAGTDQFIALPQTWAILNGNGSKDDHRIVAYTWTFLEGPQNATILRFNDSIANATGLTKGRFVFQLSVLDDNGNIVTDTVAVTVTQNKNVPPKADGGGDQVVYMPVNALVLNGSGSSDDFRVRGWEWSRQAEGLAAGCVLGHSDREPVLIITDIVPGRYVFKLTVTDDQGATDSDTVSIQVKPDPNLRSLLEATLSTPASALSSAQLAGLLQRLVLLLRQGLAVNVTAVRAEQTSQDAQIVFYVYNKTSNPPVALGGNEALSAVRAALRSGGDVLRPVVREVRTQLCQDTCSGRGSCDQATRQCRCDAFWMQSAFTTLTGRSEPNCDWSVIYAGVGAALGAAACAGMCWVVWWLLRRVCSVSPIQRRQPARYTLITATDDHEDKPCAAACSGACWVVWWLLRRVCSVSPIQRRQPARYTLITATDDHEDKPFNASKLTQSESDTDSDVLYSKGSLAGAGRLGALNNGDTPHNKARNGLGKMGRRIKA